MKHVVISVYINAVPVSVMLQLYLWHDLCNIIFKIKHKLYIVSRSASPLPSTPPNEKFLVLACLMVCAEYIYLLDRSINEGFLSQYGLKKCDLMQTPCRLGFFCHMEIM
jgi:hypothetical protein